MKESSEKAIEVNNEPRINIDEQNDNKKKLSSGEIIVIFFSNRKEIDNCIYEACEKISGECT